MANRYGYAVAEKWQNLFDFTIGVDYETYQLKLEQIFNNKTVLMQLAFDFYDCNNDEKVSEIDLFKVFQFFGQQKESKNATKTT